MSVDRVRYDRAVLVEVLVYHQRVDTAGCACGWGQLGASFAEHQADVYEQSVAESAGDEPESLDSQVGRLAEVIMFEIPGEPSQSQGAIDTAIRLLRAAYDPGGLRRLTTRTAGAETLGRGPEVK